MKLEIEFKILFPDDHISKIPPTKERLHSGSLLSNIVFKDLFLNIKFSRLIFKLLNEINSTLLLYHLFFHRHCAG
jgi:hypothetical protein